MDIERLPSCGYYDNKKAQALFLDVSMDFHDQQTGD